MVAPLFLGGARLVRFRLAAALQDLCQLVVEGLAVQQAGERIALAVVEQVLEIAVDADDAADDLDGGARVGRGVGDFQAGGDLVADPDGQPQQVAAVGAQGIGARLVARDAGGQRRVVRQRLARHGGVAGVFHAGNAARHDDGPRPHEHLATHGAQGQHTGLRCGSEFLHRRDHGNVEHRVIAVPRHVHHVFHKSMFASVYKKPRFIWWHDALYRWARGHSKEELSRIMLSIFTATSVGGIRHFNKQERAMFHTRLRQGLVIHFWELVMHTFLSAVQQFVKDEDGITAIEYGLIAALMATAITAGFLLIKTNLLAVLTDISSNLVLTP
eukprot:gene15851-18832_t